jgi:hypothetical protein
MAGPVIAGGDATGSVPRTAMPPCNLCSGTARWQASRRTAVVVDAPAAVGPNPYTTDLRHMSSAVADTPICFGRPDSRRPRGPRRSWPPGWDHPQIVSYLTQHPEKVQGRDEVQDLFGLCVDVIRRVSVEL